MFNSGFSGQSMMESLKGKRDVEKETQKIVKSIGCLWMCLASMLGGLTLCWWQYEFHATYRQLWMVPFGLILLVTPIMVSCSVFISDMICTSRGIQVHPPDDQQSKTQHDDQREINFT